MVDHGSTGCQHPQHEQSGRSITGFTADLGLYYETAGSLPQDAVLTGSGTLLAAARAEGVDLTGEDPEQPPPASAPDDPRPWLAVVDSRGRLTRPSWLRGQPYWRDILVLCSRTTPAVHLDRLRRHHVAHLVVGDDRVDLAAALHTLADTYGVRRVRVDAGATLNAALLRAGLVDEISIAGLAETGQVPLELLDVERLRDNHIWLRYAPPRS